MPLPEEVIPLATRSFSCFFETGTGYLRRIETADAEVIRAIYGAVRDQDWGTLSPSLTIDQLEQATDVFLVRFTARCDRAPISFWWNGTIRGDGGTLEFTFDGQARSTFLRNRIGLCVLHPIVECAGKPCRVQSVDGHWRDSGFPLYISPHQPFKDLQAIGWRPSPEVEAEIRFEGDVFETEDQRNWTDASFKTYCTPLELPFPVEVTAGTRVRQRVLLRLQANPAEVRSKREIPLTVTIPGSGARATLPKLGVGVAGDDAEPLSPAERKKLARLGLDHLRVDLHLSRAAWETALQNALGEAQSIGARLQCALFVSDSAETELRAFREKADPAAVDQCLIFHEAEKSTSARWFELAKRVLDGFELATGTNAYFAELNRQRPPADATACYSLNPQVHAFDELSLMETLEAQPHTVRSALQFCSRGLVISPVTLRPRFNPNATAATAEPADELPSRVDPRQRSLFGAAWTVGTLARLLPLERVESLTLYKTTGWEGLFERESGSPLPERFGSEPGEVFPVYHVFEALAGARSLLAAEVSNPNALAAVTVAKDAGRLTCLLANLTGERCTVGIEAFAPSLRLRMLDESNLPAIRKGRLPDPVNAPSGQGGITPLALGPYAVAVLELA